MGNQLGGDPQSAQIANNVFQQIVNNPQANQRQDNTPVNSQIQPRFNNRSLNGDKNMNNSSTQFIPSVQPYPSVSPAKEPFNPLASTARSNFNYNSSRVVGQNATIPTSQTSKKQKTERPFSFFQNIFGGIEEQSSQHVRSNSASSVSVNNSGRKIQLLESNLQLSERKINDLQSKINESQQIQNRYQQRIQFLQQQANMGHQQIQRLRNLLNEKQKYLRQSQVQIRTQKNQIQLQNNRLNESGIREQRKDKQIQSLSSAKFQLNSLKIRLQNNIKVLQQQIDTKTGKIGQLDKLILKKNREIQNVKHEKDQLQKNIFHLQSEIEKSNTKFQEQKGILNMTIRAHLQTIDDNQSRILQLSHKIDKYYHNQLESQAHIGNLEASISENKQFITELEKDKQNLMSDSFKFKQVIEGLNNKLEEQKINSLKSRQAADKAITDLANAKKVGQKQIQFLQTKIEELQRIKQTLNQEIQMTKAVAIQRNKIFQRSIIYDLKQQNDRLWAKLIAKSNSETDLIPEENSSRISKQPEVKSSRTRQNEGAQKQQMSRSKSQLQVRYQNFIKKLSENGEEVTITRDFSINSLQKYNQNTQFYKEKCNQLQRMVESHIILNKNLKDQLQKYQSNEGMLIKWQKEGQELRKIKTTLINQNNRLKQQIDLLRPEAEIKEKRLENKIKELQAQNKRLYDDIESLRKELQKERFSNKRSSDQAKRQQNQISSYKKWESLYDDLKKRYDQISLNSKNDYKDMFQDLQRQHERLRELYVHKQQDFQKLKRMNNQKLQNYDKEKKQRQNNIQEMKKDYEQLEKNFNIGRQEYEKLLIEARKIQNQLFRLKRQNESHALNKEKVYKLIEIFKTRIAEIDSYLRQIKTSYENEVNHYEIPQWAIKCQKVLEICSIQCDRVRESN